MTARCPYCSAGVLASQAFCSSCGRPLTGAAPGSSNQAGMYAPPQASPAPLASAAQVGKEKRHHWIWLGNLFTIGIGGYIIYAHWQGTVGLEVAIALFALAALSLGLSRFGARWKRASWPEKLLILPGVLAGLVALVVIMLSGDSDSNQSHSSSHSSSSHSASGGGDGGDPFNDNGPSTSRPRARHAFQACPRCGQPVLSVMRVCPRCGQPLL